MTARGEEWVECQIGYWRARLHGEFTAVYRGEAPWNNAGCSRRFRWIGGGDEPPRTPTVEARLEEFCRELEQAGWQRDREDVPDPWYELSFRRFVGLPEDLDDDLGGAQPPDEPTPDEEPLLTLVPVEQPAEPLGAPAAEYQLEDPVDPAPLASLTEAPAAPEVIAGSYREPDPDPSPTLAEPPAPEEEDGRPWYQAPAATSETGPVESELCARIDAYLAATR